MAPGMTIASSETSSFDVIKYAVHEGHGVKGLSELGLRSLPRQYVQPLEERIDMKTVVNQHSIPVIDMSNLLHDPQVADSICDAAEKWGFFQVVNHGVPLQVLEDVKEATYRFFRQAAEEKKKHSKDNSLTNNVRFGTSFTPHAEKALEWKDYLSLFFVSNQEAHAHWPSSCRDEALEFLNTSEIMIKNLLNALTQRLNVHNEDFDQAKENLFMGSKRINMNYYPKCPNPDLTIGVGRHSDVSTLTILLQDQVGGLYVRKLHHDDAAAADDQTTWIHVPPVPGAIVINIGDAMQIMSNGRYKSVEHRVAANGSHNRISVPIFVNPRPNDVIGPLPEVIQSGETPIYKQVLYSDYVKHFFRKAHDGKGTVDFAKI
ncbi:feruloyl CoA ortho-hydroxylase F6H1-3-like [Impatiens glandulifera]|uniref:feruloyl CoA ortho-hydroxylase F6H1-3-like n=1 Tax=Impatiens glandulifera TaxID=253017 RepID=UPI001FB0B567|nr:feruloyl CoA ortho-hydroxylase F6H1-3-like [Impatiens glandulifera]